MARTQIRRTLGVIAWLLAALLWLGGCSALGLGESDTAVDPSAAESSAGDGEEGLPAATGGLAYDVKIKGDLDDALKDLLERSSQLVQLKDRPPGSLSGLRRRLSDDLDRLGKVMRSEAYYDYSIADQIDDQVDPVAVTLTVVPGARYKLANYEVSYDGPSPAGAENTTLEELGLALGETAAAAPVAGAQKRLLGRLANRGYPFAKVADDRYVIDKEAKTLSATVTVESGPRLDFGALQVEGLEKVEESYVRRLVRWKPGTLYDARKIDAARVELVDTGLFSSVIFTPAAEENEAGEVPVTLVLAEGPRRSIGFAVGASTDEIFDFDVFWDHRNLDGEGANLRLKASGSFLRQEGEARYAKPNFRRLDQTLIARSTVAHEDSDAFEELAFNQFIGAERLLAPGLTFSSGPSFEVSRIDDDQSNETFGLVGFPMTLTFDDRDDPLNPTTGWRLGFASTPYLGVLFEPTQFWSNKATASSYLSLDAEDRVVLAGRFAIGSIFGDSRADIPANKRFYAGGGGSVRGYEFRSIGPLDSDNDPIGGRSVVEVSVETRLRVTEIIGLVPFIDGGQVYRDPWIDLDENLRWAAGLGLRYFSPIGPLRLDVAFPLNRRKGVDNRFEFYVSIGQAF